MALYMEHINLSLRGKGGSQVVLSLDTKDQRGKVREINIHLLVCLNGVGSKGR